MPIDEKKEPIAPLGTMFWFRPRAMKLLFDRDWEYEDFPPEPNAIDGTFIACNLKEYIVMLFNRKVIIRHGLYLINVQI